MASISQSLNAPMILACCLLCPLKERVPSHARTGGEPGEGSRCVCVCMCVRSWGRGQVCRHGGVWGPKAPGGPSSQREVEFGAGCVGWWCVGLLDGLLASGCGHSPFSALVCPHGKSQRPACSTGCVSFCWAWCNLCSHGQHVPS